VITIPYIKSRDRVRIEFCTGKINPIGALIGAINTEGDLNYVITRLCHKFLEKKGKKYSTLNTIIGVLECAKQEFYRKVCSPYEDLKEKENGSL